MRRAGFVFFTVLVLVPVASTPSSAAQENKASGDGISTILPYPEVVNLSITFSAKTTPDSFGKVSFNWDEGIQGQPMTGPYSWAYIPSLTFTAWEPGNPKAGGYVVFWVAYQPGTLLADYIQALSANAWVQRHEQYCPDDDPYLYEPGSRVEIMVTDQDNYFPGSTDWISIGARYCATQQWWTASEFVRSSSTQGNIKVRIYN